jgi:surfeit locus 1 family protein
MEKRASLDAFSAEGGFESYYAGMDVRPFQQLRATGEYWSDRQVLIDNMIQDGRNGHFVITPLELAGDGPLLLVNRGWIEKIAPGGASDRVRLGPVTLTVRGRVGTLPRAGMRMGDAFADADEWPKHAVFPKADDVAAELDRAVLPFVLLLDAAEPNGYVREWEPEEMSASRHFGYAFQWFAMAAVLSGLLVWRFRRRRAASRLG